MRGKLLNVALALVVLFIVLLVVGMWRGYQQGRHNADRFADCLDRARSSYEMTLCR